MKKLQPISILGVLLAVLAAPALAQAPADSVFKDFQPSGEFEIQLDGKTLETAELFHAERAGAYLVMAPEISSPLLINARTRTVEQVSFMKVAKREGGTIDLLADASFQTVGPFAVGAQQLSFTFKGRKIVLASKPPLTGLHPPAGLVSHNPAYGFKSKQYEPDPSQLAALKAQTEDVRVRIYFGNWCPVCGRLVPKVLRIDEELGDAGPKSEYYGLPQPMSDDPITSREDINGVPTGIVYVDGKEVGRLSGRDLFKPEAALTKMLTGG